MALKRLRDLDPNYTDFGDNVIGFEVYTEGNEEKVGSVKDILLDESGHFRYLVIDFGLWIFNKRVMLPIGRSRVDIEAQRVYILDLSQKQVEDLPEYNDCALVDDDYEKQIREVYRTPEVDSAVNSKTPEDQANLDPIPDPIAAPANATYDNPTPDRYQRLALYEMNDRDHLVLKQYQDRLLARNHDSTEGEAVFDQQSEAIDIETTASDSETVTPSACLIFNPVAGQSDSEQDLATIQRILQPKINLDIRTTTPDIDADQLAREAVEQGAKMIIASGGDGTLSGAAAAVVGTGVPFGVISRGTANAFATALGIPLTIEAACQTILDGTTRVVDAADCNGKPMVLLAGIGFEAEAVERADRRAKNRFGMLAYVLAGVQELSDFKSFETQLETEDKVITFDAAAVTIANAAPPTSVLAQGPAELVVDDGLLDVTIVAPANSIGAIAAAYNLLQSADSEATTNRSDTGYLRAKSIKVTTNPPQEVVLDGELIGHTPVEVKCVPGGLTIFVPAVPEDTPTEKLEGLPNLHVELKEPKVD